MTDKKLSQELITVFEYIKNTINKNNQSTTLDEYVLVSSMLHNEKSLAYKVLSSIVIEDTLNDVKAIFDASVDHFNTSIGGEEQTYEVFDKYFNESYTMCSEFGTKEINSSYLLLTVIKNHDGISQIFKNFSIDAKQVHDAIKNNIPQQSTQIIVAPKKHIKKQKKDNVSMVKPIKIIETTSNDSELKRSTTNISQLASLGKVQSVIGYDKYYDDIFAILSKKFRNNVVISGRHGVGKTATVENIANLINEKKCNINFHNKTIVKLDFAKLVIGTPFKGAFEQKFYSILEEAKEYGNYIFFIDDIDSLIDGSTKYSETDTENILSALFSEPLIPVICTITPKNYSRLINKTSLGKFVQCVTIDEPNDDEVMNILNNKKNIYEVFHDVKFDETALHSCVNICRKYITHRGLPDSALDVLDSVGAKFNMKTKENLKLTELNNKLEEIEQKIEEVKSSSDIKPYDEIDQLTKEKISIKAQMSNLEKEEILTKQAKLITKNEICEVLSKEIDLPLEELTQTEKTRLKGLSGKIKKCVVGQDEAVDEVCRSVKRQRVGLGEDDRPAVLMFLGSTGTGKTYLAKELAKEVFGNEKYFVRMDMSEYADKTKVNNITGSSAGFVGYEDETFFVKALKNKKRFVLLLDEIEKAGEEIHNMFLQIFDEGRFTDNHGETYSLKDVIIIMTSNVGVAESVNRGKPIGFSQNDYDFSHEIIEKELKKKFKPEFINRIQKIIYFNNLDNDNIKSIVKLEINKINKKIEKLGYHLAEDILKTKMVNYIYDIVIKQKEYGARPIVNEVQRNVEDNIVNYIIDNDISEGHTFTYDELNGCN